VLLIAGYLGWAAALPPPEPPIRAQQRDYAAVVRVAGDLTSYGPNTQNPWKSPTAAVRREIAPSLGGLEKLRAAMLATPPPYEPWSIQGPWSMADPAVNSDIRHAGVLFAAKSDWNMPQATSTAR
jgi:hypothetical protein